MAAARFPALQRIEAEQFGELQEIGDPSRLFQRLVEFLIFAQHIHILPEFGADFGKLLQRFL